MSQADIDHVYDRHLKYLEAMENADVDSLMNYVTDDAIMLPPDHPPARGAAAIRAWYEEAFAQAKTDRLDARNEDYLEIGDLIIETGEGTWDMTPEVGEAVSLEVKWLAVWQRQSEGGWKIVRSIFN